MPRDANGRPTRQGARRYCRPVRLLLGCLRGTFPCATDPPPPAQPTPGANARPREREHARPSRSIPTPPAEAQRRTEGEWPQYQDPNYRPAAAQNAWYNPPPRRGAPAPAASSAQPAPTQPAPTQPAPTPAAPAEEEPADPQTRCMWNPACRHPQHRPPCPIWQSYWDWVAEQDAHAGMLPAGDRNQAASPSTDSSETAVSEEEEGTSCQDRYRTSDLGFDGEWQPPSSACECARVRIQPSLSWAERSP